MALRDVVQERLIKPAIALFKQGLTPERLTASIVAGGYCGLLPMPGCTTAVTTVVGLVFRLNQPVMQFINQAIGPLQILLLIPYIRIGERMFAEPPLPLSVTQILDMFQADMLNGFQTLWSSIWHAALAWLVVSPVVTGLAYAALKPGVRVLLARFTRPDGVESTRNQMVPPTSN